METIGRINTIDTNSLITLIIIFWSNISVRILTLSVTCDTESSLFSGPDAVCPVKRGGPGDFLCLLWAWGRICVSAQLAAADKVAQMLEKGSSNSHYKVDPSPPAPPAPSLCSGRNKDFCCFLKYRSSFYFCCGHFRSFNTNQWSLENRMGLSSALINSRCTALFVYIYTHTYFTNSDN